MKYEIKSEILLKDMIQYGKYDYLYYTNKNII